MPEESNDENNPLDDVVEHDVVEEQEQNKSNQQKQYYYSEKINSAVKIMGASQEKCPQLSERRRVEMQCVAESEWEWKWTADRGQRPGGNVIGTADSA